MRAYSARECGLKGKKKHTQKHNCEVNARSDTTKKATVQYSILYTLYGFTWLSVYITHDEDGIAEDEDVDDDNAKNTYSMVSEYNGRPHQVCTRNIRKFLSRSLCFVGHDAYRKKLNNIQL